MNPLQKLRLMVARGVVRLVKDAGLQEIQADLLDNETRDGVERIQNFGFRGHPPQGSVVAAVAVAGSRDHLLIVACEHPQFTPQLKQGETAMYSQYKQLFKMDKNGNVILQCKDFRVEAAGSVDIQVTQKFSVNAGGALNIVAARGSSIQGSLTADSVSAPRIESNGVVLDEHDHIETNGGQTGGVVK